MEYQSFERYEYKYAPLYSSIDTSVNMLNQLGEEGWELIELEKPKSVGEQYKAILKRKLDCIKTS